MSPSEGSERGEEGAARATLLDTYIAGVRYYEAGRRVSSLQAGTHFTLALEPDNPHDPLAVAVLMPDGAKLGYVPRPWNAGVALRMQRGVPLEAQATKFAAWPHVGIRITCGLADAAPLPDEPEPPRRRPTPEQRAEKDRRSRVQTDLDLARWALANAERDAHQNPARATESALHAVESAVMAWLRLRGDATVRPQFFANSESFLAYAPTALGRRYARWRTLCAAVARATERPGQPETKAGPKIPETASQELQAPGHDSGPAQDADATEPIEVWNLDGVADALIATLRPARIGQAVRFVVWEAAALVEAMHPTPSAADAPAAHWPVERRGRWLWGFARLAEVIDRTERGDRPAITALRVLGVFDESPQIVRSVVANAIESERRLLPRSEAEIEKARSMALRYPDIFGDKIEPARRNPLIDEAADLVGAWPQRRSEIPDLVDRLRQTQPHSRRHGRSRPRVAPDRVLYRIELMVSALSRAQPKLYDVALALAIAERPVRLLNRLLPHAVRDMAEALSRASFGLPWSALCAHLPAPGLRRPGPATWVRGMDEFTEADEAHWRSASAHGTFQTPSAGRRRSVLHYRRQLMLASTLARGRAARNFAANLAKADFAFLAQTEARPEGLPDEPPAGCHALIEWWYWRDFGAAPFPHLS